MHTEWEYLFSLLSPLIRRLSSWSSLFIRDGWPAVERNLSAKEVLVKVWGGFLFYFLCPRSLGSASWSGCALCILCFELIAMVAVVTEGPDGSWELCSTPSRWNGKNHYRAQYPKASSPPRAPPQPSSPSPAPPHSHPTPHPVLGDPEPSTVFGWLSNTMAPRPPVPAHSAEKFHYFSPPLPPPSLPLQRHFCPLQPIKWTGTPC